MSNDWYLPVWLNGFYKMEHISDETKHHMSYVYIMVSTWNMNKCDYYDEVDRIKECRQSIKKKTNKKPQNLHFEKIIKDRRSLKFRLCL